MIRTLSPGAKPNRFPDQFEDAIHQSPEIIKETELEEKRASVFLLKNDVLVEKNPQAFLLIGLVSMQ